MAIISPSTFDPLKRYIAVRLQQGVPLVDADWNEADDTQRFELRSYLKWFVGNGVPEGNDGFRVAADGSLGADDFMITRGTLAAPGGATNQEVALGYAGRILVDGLDAMIFANLAFRSQPLHVASGGSAALAAAWGVSTISELPHADTDIIVYIDVWDRLVTPGEDPSLVFTALGTESCARLKREWAVRWRLPTFVTEVPTRGDPDWLPGHGYYALATVTRHSSGSGTVLETDVIDRREKRLLMLPASLTEDMLGVSATSYRRGEGRPPISFREAINAGIAGEIPMSAESRLMPSTFRNILRRAVHFDTLRNSMAVYSQASSGGAFDVDLHLIDVTTGAVTLYPVAPGTTESSWPDGLVLPNGDHVVVYVSDPGSPLSTLVYKRGAPGDLLAAPPQTITTSADPSSALPLVVRTGNVLTFIWFDGTSPSSMMARRLRHTDNVWLDAAGFDISLLAVTETVDSTLFHAISDASGLLWCAFTINDGTSNSVVVSRFDPSVTPPSVTRTTVATGGTPVLFQRASGDILLFFTDPAVGLQLATWQVSSSSWATTTVPGPDTTVAAPWPFEDRSGALWVSYNVGGFGFGLFIYMIRQSATTGAWGQPRAVIGSSGTINIWSTAVMAPDGEIWLFWDRLIGFLTDLGVFYKRVITVI